VGNWESCEKFEVESDFGGPYPTKSISLVYEFRADGAAILTMTYKEELGCRTDLSQKTIDTYKAQVLSECRALNNSDLANCQEIADKVCNRC